MPEVVYYVAASLDGFIARTDGGIDWLSTVEVSGEDYGYADFFDSVDGLVMGRATFDQVQTFGEWPYADRPCWIWTRRPVESLPPSAVATRASPRAIVEEAARQGMSRLWLVGGGELAGAFQAARLIDTYVVSVIPVLLGEGVPLIPCPGTLRLRLTASRSYESGLVQLTYAPGEIPAAPIESSAAGAMSP